MGNIKEPGFMGLVPFGLEISDLFCIFWRNFSRFSGAITEFSDSFYLTCKRNTAYYRTGLLAIATDSIWSLQQKIGALRALLRYEEYLAAELANIYSENKSKIRLRSHWLPAS